MQDNKIQPSDKKNTKIVKKVVRVDNPNQTTTNATKTVKKIVKVAPSEYSEQEKQKIINAQKQREAEAKKAEQERIAKAKAEAERLEKERQRKIKQQQEEVLRKKREEEARQKEILRKKQIEEANRIKAEKAAAKEQERIAKEKDKEIQKQREAEAKVKEQEQKEKEKQIKKEEEKAAAKDLTTIEKVFKFVKVAIFSLLVLMFSGAGVLSLIIYSWVQDMPKLDTTLLTEAAQTSYIYDADGVLLTTFSGAENRDWVQLEDIPDDLIQAFLSIEDKRYYEHDAIDIKRFVSAVLGQLTGSSSHGGSTITQQLVKNVYLTNEVTYKRKVQEIFLAMELEKQMSKDDILEAYLNVIYFGSSNYGVSAAADDYFGKNLHELTLREMAMLAGIPKNPNGYNPRTNTYIKKDMSRTNTRTDNVLWVMHEDGLITDAEYQDALNEKVEIKETSSFYTMYPYAHFIEYAIENVIDDLLIERNLEDNYTNRVRLEYEIRNGGYSIYTTLERDTQEVLQESVSTWDKYPHILDSNGKAIKNEAGEYIKPQVAAVIMNHDKGYVVAMVGNRDEVDSKKTLNRALDNNMPIASTIKPLAVYAAAIEQGANPASITYNFSTKIMGYDSKVDYPGGSSPETPVTLREATKTSYNISAARFLCNYVGYDLSEDYLLQLGISKDHISKTGSGLALGTSGINMLELTNAYASLANSGYYKEAKAYTKLVDHDGKTILDSSKTQIVRKVFSDETAWLMTDILIDTVNSGGGYKAKIDGLQVAGKTGTHENKCAVFAGYTKDYTSAIWIGSDSYAPLSDSSGGHQAAPVFADYMSRIYEVKELAKNNIYQSRPTTVKKYTVCALSGNLATDSCPEKITDYFSIYTAPTKNCEMHTVLRYCSYSGLIATDECNSNFTYKKAVTFIPNKTELGQVDPEYMKEKFPDYVLDIPESYCASHVNGLTILSQTQIDYGTYQLQKLTEYLSNPNLTPELLAILGQDYIELQEYVNRATLALSGNYYEENLYNNYFSVYNRVKANIATAQGYLDSLVLQ